MTRIAGVLTAAHERPLTTVLTEMLSRFHVPRALTRTLTKPHAALGALDIANAELAFHHEDSVIVAVDGSVFNAHEFTHDGSAPARIILKLYQQHGFVGALQRINGDFAVAVYDAGTGTLWLGRDRIGVRPLYYAAGEDCFAFASQPRALNAVPGVTREVSPRFCALFAGSHYRTFDNDIHASPFVQIAQLPAGHYLEVQSNSAVAPRVSRYWTVIEQPDFDLPERELAAQYRELLLDAVRLRVRAAHNPAFLLSGGMDSSSVLASAVRILGAKQHAFSSVYEDRTYDESDEIRSMLGSAVAEWHAITVEVPDLFAIVERMIGAHDEPVATATWLSHFLLCEQAAARGVGTLFGGLGGDELNAGEYEYFFFHFADVRRTNEAGRLQREVESWAKYHDHPIYRKNMDVVSDAFRRLVDLDMPGCCKPDRSRLERYAAALDPDIFDLRSFTPVMDQPFTSYLKNRTYQDIFRETAPCCLRAEDRQSAAFGLQHFDPFFDYRLLEFMFRVPGSMKIRDGVTKILLREATKDLLPEATRTRIKKTGWNAPAHVWFSGPTLARLRDLVGSRQFAERGIYRVSEVTRIMDDHEEIIASGAVRENHMMFLWQLLNLELWLQAVARW